MTQNILVISGAKQAGKDTACNFLHGYIMKNVGITRDFFVDENGNLNVFSATHGEDGEVVTSMRGLDVNSDSFEFCKWASQSLWRYVKSYHFADNLKDICIDIFGLDKEKAYGSDDDKNEETKIKWGDIYFALPPRKVGTLKKEGKTDSFMTIREFIQFFGTDICRKIHNSCWTDSTFKTIDEEDVPMAIIADCRFSNEVEAAQDKGAKVIRLGRSPYESDHISENDLNGWKPEQFDAYIDNSDITVEECNEAVLKVVQGWGWLNFEEQKESE